MTDLRDLKTLIGDRYDAALPPARARTATPILCGLGTTGTIGGPRMARLRTPPAFAANGSPWVASGPMTRRAASLPSWA